MTFEKKLEVLDVTIEALISSVYKTSVDDGATIEELNDAMNALLNASHIIAGFKLLT